MFKTIIRINLIFLFISSLSIAQTIIDVKVDGNKRISKESIIVFGNIKFDKDYNDDDLNTVLKRIYETNFFKEIDLKINNSILHVTVIENPIIENIQINGVKRKSLTDLLSDKIKLKNRSSYIESAFLSDLNLVKNILKSGGYYFADVKTTSILNEEQNSIRLTYNIDLGKKAKIHEVQFIGDKKIKDRKLKNIITSEESKF